MGGRGLLGVIYILFSLLLDRCSGINQCLMTEVITDSGLVRGLLSLTGPGRQHDQPCNQPKKTMRHRGPCICRLVRCNARQTGSVTSRHGSAVHPQWSTCLKRHLGTVRAGLVNRGFAAVYSRGPNAEQRRQQRVMFLFSCSLGFMLEKSNL